MLSFGVDFASASNFPGDQAGAVLLEKDDDGHIWVLGSWRGFDAVMRARRLALACDVKVLQEGHAPSDE